MPFLIQAEKIGLHDEKQRLRQTKKNLEQQLQAINGQLGYPLYLSPVPMPFAAQSQEVGNKSMPFISFPGIAMWQLMPPSVVDTSQDHVLRPPVA